MTEFPSNPIDASQCSSARTADKHRSGASQPASDVTLLDGARAGDLEALTGLFDR
jgi:hypothetical protein